LVQKHELQKYYSSIFNLLGNKSELPQRLLVQTLPAAAAALRRRGDHSPLPVFAAPRAAGLENGELKSPTSAAAGLFFPSWQKHTLSAAPRSG